MEIKKIYEDENTLKIGIEGRLDTMTAPELENFLKQEIEREKVWIWICRIWSISLRRGCG